MKKWIFTALAVSALVLPAAAFAGKDHPFLTFGPGKVLVNEKTKQASITNAPGESGGLYATKAAPSKKLTKVVFKFTTDGDVQGGAPRWSIPIDTTGDKGQDGYAFLDAAGCGARVGTTDTVTVSTANKDCHVNFLGVDYPNWAAFAAAYPTGKVAKKNIPFII